MKIYNQQSTEEDLQEYMQGLIHRRYQRPSIPLKDAPSVEAMVLQSIRNGVIEVIDHDECIDTENEFRLLK
jgi:hypothetical protein